MSYMQIGIRHWMPIPTICPVNGLPDLVYVTVFFTVEHGEDPPELYAVRKRIRKLVTGRRMFMEDIARLVLNEFPAADCVQVRLLFDRHFVHLEG